VARRRRAEGFYACGALEAFRAARSTRTLDCTVMPAEYQIVETFEITGRGAVVVVEDVPSRTVGTALRVEILLPDGNVISAEAHREFPLRRQPQSAQSDAFWLKGLHKDQVPPGSRIRFLE
jgi:hypothetical protein